METMRIANTPEKKCHTRNDPRNSHIRRRHGVPLQAIAASRHFRLSNRRRPADRPMGDDRAGVFRAGLNLWSHEGDLRSGTLKIIFPDRRPSMSDGAAQHRPWTSQIGNGLA
jgi:hypothetical protein